MEKRMTHHTNQLLKFHKKTIRREFFVTGLISTLIIAAVFITFISLSVYYLSLQNAQEKLKSGNQHLTTYTEGVLESLVMSTKMNAVSTLVSNFHKGDLEAEKQILTMFANTTEANPNIKFCYAGYEDATLLINGYEPPIGYDPRTRPWYTSAVKSYPAYSVGIPYQEIKSNEWLISISVALTDSSGHLNGVMTVDCTLEYVIDMMEKDTNFDTQSNYVIDSESKVFVHRNRNYVNTKIDSIVPGLSKLFVDNAGVIKYDLNGKKRIAYYQKMALSDWVVVSAIDESEILNPIIFKLSVIVPALIVLAILLGMVQVLIYERSFVKPIVTLRDRIAEITTGKSISNMTNQFSNLELSEISKRIEDMAETALRKKSDELALILDATSDAILVLDLSGKIIHANDKYNDLLETLLSAHVPENHHRVNLSSLNETLETLLMDHGKCIEQYACPVMDQGVVRGRLWRYRDITDKVKAEEDLKRLATTDSLTELWNRRYFLEKGTLEIEMVKRTGLPLSLLFIDIDHFKQVNDTYGHAVGDEALKHMASILKKFVRSTDLVSRFGGEEFCLLTPNTSIEAAFQLAEKLRGYFDDHSIFVLDHMLHYTISIGVSSYVANETGIDGLLAAADKACYEAKNNGRNCVVKSS